MIKKNFKKKYLISGIIGLAVISLVAVGFSAWVIDGSIDDEATNVSVTIGAIKDKTLIVEVDDKNSDYNIAFENLESGTDITNGDGKKEDMSFSINYKLISTREINTSEFKLTFSIEENVINAYKALMDNNNNYEYINTSCLNNFSFDLPASNQTLMSNSDTVKTEITYSSDFKSANVITTFTFSWGSYFNKENPGLYYNEGDDLSVYQELSLKLANFESAIANGLPQIGITITPSYEEALSNE